MPSVLALGHSVCGHIFAPFRRVCIFAKSHRSRPVMILLDAGEWSPSHFAPTPSANAVPLTLGIISVQLLGTDAILRTSLVMIG